MINKKIAPPKGGPKSSSSADVSTLRFVTGDMPVFEVQKSARERFRISFSHFKGKEYIDLRVWYLDQAGDFQPSQRGVSIRPELIAQVVQGLMLAAKAAPMR